MNPTDRWGVDRSYQDAFQKWHKARPETIQAIHDAMGASGEPPRSEPVIVIQAGKRQPVRHPGTITLEDGSSLRAEKAIPAGIPQGYHTFRPDRGPEQRLIATPGKCWLPDGQKSWGWAVQLYAARSRESWGIGDFADLARLADWSAKQQGAGMLLVNPLSAAIPVKAQQASPYYPSSRRFFNPLWLRVEWVPGVAEHARAVEHAARAARDLNQNRLIDRDRVYDLKMRTLDLLWNDFPSSDEEFLTFCREQGPDLDRYAVFCTLAEQYNGGWHSWPAEFQHPESPAVAHFAQQHHHRVEFHKWLQWLLDKQLSHCSEKIAIMQDLPIGVDPSGADAWAWQDVFAKQTGVGAPPDEFNTQGQNWGLPPFIPHKLREVGYAPFIQTIRAVLRNGGGLRIDHVMGLFRLFWIPEGMQPKDGAYVRYNADELLAIVAIESQRARAYVVGEDLGTVETEVRRKLASKNVLSYRLLWFEKKHPKTYPEQALAAVTTHDLPTVAGLWTGSDLARQEELHLKPNAESTNEIHQRLARTCGLEETSPLEQVIEKAHGLLAHAPCRILTAALEDAAAVEQRPNIPATTCEQNPNWSQALPVPIEDLMAQELPEKIARALARRSR